MTKEQLNTILTGLHTGTALSNEELDRITGDDCMHTEERDWCLREATKDVMSIQAAIQVVEKALKEVQ